MNNRLTSQPLLVSLLNMSISKRSIALVGVGAIGTPILRAFLNNPNHPTVIVLTRPESKTRDLPAELSAASRIPVDYTDIDTLTAIFKEHSTEVVVSALPPPGYKAQYALADAAKASGTVKLFVPSEWGSPTEGAKEKGEKNIFAVKDGVAGG